MIKMQLTRDIISFTRPKIKYGAANEVVNVISESGEVAIVAGESGKFPVRKEFLKTINIKNEQRKN